MDNVLKINGVEKSFPRENVPRTLTELLSQLNIEAATVVAEIDGQIIQRKNFENTKITQGQAIELVRFVGGG